MNEDQGKTFKKTSFSLDYLASLLNFDGRPTRVWIDRETERLHVVFEMNDGSGQKLLDGGYIQDRSLWSEQIDNGDGTSTTRYFHGPDLLKTEIVITENRGNE